MKKIKFLKLSLVFIIILGFAHSAWGMEPEVEKFSVGPKKSRIEDTVEGARKNIAIIGAGPAGLVQALAFSKKFPLVNIHLFDQRKDLFDLSHGVELVITPQFQIVMKALGCDMTPELQKYGYPCHEDCMMDSRGTRLLEAEEQLRSSRKGLFTDPIELRADEYIQLNTCNISRATFMKLLYEKLMSTNKNINFYKEYQLDRIASENMEQTLYFKNGRSFKNFALIVGADGVHSKVREFFDDHKPSHVGANFVYGIIPHPIEIHAKNKFNVICSKDFSIASSYIVNPDGETLTTWWAMVYPDQKEDLDAKQPNPPEIRAFWESPANVKAAVAHKLVSREEGETFPKQYFRDTTEFRYAGCFLERDPSLLKKWGKGGKDKVVLIGDAVHAMQPWAGIGASLAAEDAYVLASSIASYGFDRLEDAFDGFQRSRINRVLYFQQITRKNTPRGIMPEVILDSIEELNQKYGDHRPPQTCPAWIEMVEKHFMSLDNKATKDPLRVH